MSKGIFASLHEAGQPFALIDTRERRDHVNGHWFGSTNIPLSLLVPQINRLVPERDFPIHLLDWQDAPSKAAANLLSSQGYNFVTRCKTSQPDAFGQGFVKGEYVWSKAFGELVAHTSGLPEVTPADYIANYKKANLYDVRPTAEYSLFTIPDSQSLPNSLLLANMAMLKQTDNMALLHCAGRTRSIIGACTLKAAGYSGSFAIFKGGTQAWQLDGFEREFNATRVFAKETADVKPVKDFLAKWNIKHLQLDNTDLDAFIKQHRQEHLFDVSDDAATGQLVEHNIFKISGTNLIQQTDRSIARYHVPVILFDYGSGSRAAFAAYWLQTMGFSVSIVYLTNKLTRCVPERLSTPEISYPLLTTEELLKLTEATVFDLRASQAYCQRHLKGSLWGNISELLSREVPSTSAVLIGNDVEHASQCADLLARHGWKIAGVYCWSTGNTDIDQQHIHTTTINTPVDECALFAQRHHGNMQDSRDYLAWEEALPDQIDPEFTKLWHKLLSASVL